eukprot:c9169_g1_i1 orf=119-328(+)
MRSGKCILMRDLNMIESKNDMRGGTEATIQGGEKEDWNLLKWRTGLVDIATSEMPMMTWSNCRVEGRIE